MARHGYAPVLPSPSTLASPEILGSPFQLRKLLHRHSDPKFSDVDLFEAIDMGEHAAWANLDDPIYAEKDFEIYRALQPQSSLPAYYIKGWLPYSADTLLNTITDVRYRQEWDKLIRQTHVIDRHPERTSDVVYCAVRLPWPLADRDYVYQRRTKYFAQQNAFVVISQAAQHSKAPEERKGTVRVETFGMRLSIRSTGTNSCDFFMEYEDDTNFSIPNYVISWMLSVQVPSFMNELRKACANYVAYTKTLDEASAWAIPSTIARRRAQEREQQSSSGAGSVGSPVALSPSTTKQWSQSQSSSVDHPKVVASSVHSSEMLSRRNAQQRSDSYSENGEAGSSSCESRTRRTRRFFHSRSHDIEKDSSGKANGTRKRDLLMKKTGSLHKIFASKQTAAFKDPTSAAEAQETVVEFHRQRIGLHLEADVHSNRILVAHCEKDSEAAKCERAIAPGMVVTSVNGSLVSKLPSSEVLEAIASARRPLTLGFSTLRAVSSSTPSRKKTEPHNVLRCVFTRDNHCDLLKLLGPLDADANVGAVLRAKYAGQRVSKKKAPKSPRNGDFSSRKSTRLQPGQFQPQDGVVGSRTVEDRVTIPEGAVLFEIDHCHVVSLPFAEVVHLLSRNSEPKTLSFKPGLAIGGDRERDTNAGQNALSKRLSMAFRWKSGSEDSPTASPMGGNATKGGSGFKSTSTTEASSVLSGEGTSDPDDMDDTARQKGSHAQCLPDYSKVVITTRNIAWAWEQVHLLKQDERVFSAAMLIEKIEAFMMKEPTPSSSSSSPGRGESATVKSVFNKMHDEREWINEIKERRTLGVRALHEFNNEEDAEWIFGQAYFGVSTHWKPGADGTVWLKLDGLVEGVDIFNTIAVMREIDLFSCWVPFCTQSSLVQKTGYVDVLAYVGMVFPLLKRDAVIRAVGINACYESRCILLLGGSVDESRLARDLKVPKMKGWNTDRLEMKAFRVLIEPITRTKGRTCIVCNVDPKCPIPKTLLNFAIKKVAGILLFLLRKEAEKIEKTMQDGTSGSDHVARLKDDPDGFYAWLRPLFDRWFADQQNNTLPPPLKFSRASDVNETDAMDRSNSTATGSFHSRASSFGESNMLDPSGRMTSASHSKPSTTTSLAREGARHEATASTGLQRTWVDYLYDFGIWPYFLLLIFSHVTPHDSFLYVCFLKLLFTCTCTWFGVPGAYSWQTRQRKRACRELDTLRKRCVLLAALCDVINSWVVGVWVKWLLCYMALSQASVTVCQQRTPLEIRASENFWLSASAFTFASVVVGIQVVVNI